ncbi:MAG TPA: hypothetical protein VK704_01195 [Acidimicrobiales bacterium]|nr:hypothetical protein [Acidimicrobiales bacterium]
MTGVSLRQLSARLARRPGDVLPVTRAAWRLRRRGWWRHAPFLPLPGPAYWRFRVATATGSPTGRSSADDVVEFAKWSMRQKSER